MIKINSEVPLCMLGQNNDLNDYDFVLFHLYKTNQTYKEYFLNQRQSNPDRLMIFDNSAYEFFVKGEELKMEEFYKAIVELKPDYYILPDTLMNRYRTIVDTWAFIRNYGEKIQQSTNSKPLAVIQGKSIEDFMECAVWYADIHIDAIAVPFHNSFYKEMEVDDDIEQEFLIEFGPNNLDAKYAMGRVQFFKDYGEYLKKTFKHIHILGSHQPFEKRWYHDFDTMDTGYPVKCGLEGMILGEDFIKPDVIIDDFLTKDLPDDVRTLIANNIRTFKQI